MARTTSLILLLSTLFWSTAGLTQDPASGGTDQCLSCHDYSEHSPIRPLLDSPHWQPGNPANPLATQGCEACHGPSAAHAQKPTQVEPAVSYGPRWNSGIEKQTAACQTCHGETVGKHWEGGKHQQENLTCNSCHTGHAAKDKVLTASGERDICLVCHKPQKSGMHNLKTAAGDSPACSQCHNPHENPDPKLAMLSNRSAGCVHCHNLVAMSRAPGANPKAASYHKTMTQPGRLCTDCHQGIAHAPAQGVAPLVAQGVRKKTVTAFSPGKSSAEWMVSQHPGAQSLRQGRDCEQCHQGEERTMGEALAKRGQAVSRDIDVAFAKTQDQLRVTLSWQGPADDQQISIMWGNDGNEAFRRGGCWASCHDDMPGMSQDRGQQQGKYLSAARAQQQLIGQPAKLRSSAELARLRSEGNYVEIWQASLDKEKPTPLRGGTILNQLSWSDNSELEGQVEYTKGRWTVTFTRPLKGGPGGAKSFLPGKQYTFGIALGGAQLPAQDHWVTLPLTFSLDDRETDFVSPQ
jgi:DmsE family decaheme c-type cytochrome